MQHLPSTADDSLLEQMTQSLLEISSTFLVQQHELQEVKDRLNKEMLRVNSIQETLTMAAQKHQDAVLAVIQNYENLATELPPVPPPMDRAQSLPAGDGTAGGAAPPVPSPARSSSASIDTAAGSTQFPTVAQVHLPPAATGPSVFKPAPKSAPPPRTLARRGVVPTPAAVPPDRARDPLAVALGDEGEEEGGIEYVANLQACGGG